MKSTNYKNMLIEIAEDCQANKGEIPPYRGEKKTVANYEYEMIFNSPYQYTSDEVKFTIHVARKSIPESEYEAEKELFFSKGQPCFRASPLTKKYGWGVHANEEGKIALYGFESKEYARLLVDASTAKVKAMRSKRK